MGAGNRGLVLLSAILLASGCGGADGATTLADAGIGSGDGSATAAVAPGMRALLDRRCVGCHQPGGTGQGDYTIDTEVLSRRLSIGTAVAARTMPPWMPDPSCGSFDGDLSLTNEELALVADWAAGGEPQAAVSPVEGARPDPGPPDLRLAADEPYVPNPEELTDRTACHPIGPTFALETLIRGVAFKLSRPELIHHLVLYAVPDDQVVATPAAGAGAYSCDGMNLIPIAAAIQMAEPYLLPAGVAVPVPAGYRLLLQVHYNIAALPAGDPIPSVTSALDLWTADAATAQPLNIYPVNADDLVVAAGDAEGSATSSTLIERPMSIYGLVPHMHIFGTAFYATLQRADGTEECLVSIPSWRFLEQRVFFRPAGAELTLQPGDSIRLRCEYDNSYANQPLVRGVRGEPRDLTFGWRSVDEMCELNLLTVTP
jgi:hypothetical protein